MGGELRQDVPDGEFLTRGPNGRFVAAAPDGRFDFVRPAGSMRLGAPDTTFTVQPERLLIRVEDEGTPVVSSPNLTLDFVGDAVEVTDAGGGKATISIDAYTTGDADDRFVRKMTSARGVAYDGFIGGIVTLHPVDVDALYLVVGSISCGTNPDTVSVLVAYQDAANSTTQYVQAITDVQIGANEAFPFQAAVNAKAGTDIVVSFGSTAPLQTTTKGSAAVLKVS